MSPTTNLPPRFRPVFRDGTYARRLVDLDVPERLWSKPISAALWIAAGESVDELRRAANLAAELGFIVPVRWPKRRRRGPNEPLARLPLTSEGESDTRWQRAFNLFLAIARALVLRALDGDIKAANEIARRLEGSVGIPRHLRLIGSARAAVTTAEENAEARLRREQIARIVAAHDEAAV
jgi:hypothetical protein